MVRGQGMPSFRHHDHGNLYIHFDVKFPDRIGTQGVDGATLTPEDVASLERILPKRVTPTAVPAGALTEDFVLEEVELTRDGRGMDLDDDDEEMGGAERVQCATQ
jgi:DnaJ family protein A protein 2